MLEILKTHLRKKTAELAKQHAVNESQIEIIWHENDFFYKVNFNSQQESPKFRLSL